MNIKIYGCNPSSTMSMVNGMNHNIEEYVADLNYINLAVIDGMHCVMLENIRMIVDRKEYDRLAKLLKVDIEDADDTIESDKDEVDNNVDDLEVD